MFFRPKIWWWTIDNFLADRCGSLSTNRGFSTTRFPRLKNLVDNPLYPKRAQAAASWCRPQNSQLSLSPHNNPHSLAYTLTFSRTSLKIALRADRSADSTSGRAVEVLVPSRPTVACGASTFKNPGGTHHIKHYIMYCIMVTNPLNLYRGTSSHVPMNKPRTESHYETKRVDVMTRHCDTDDSLSTQTRSLDLSQVLTLRMETTFAI